MAKNKKSFQERVDSSWVKKIKYSAKSKTLTVDMKDGSKYKYDDVPKDVAEKLKDAPSTGKGMHALVLDEFDFERVK